MHCASERPSYPSTLGRGRGGGKGRGYCGHLAAGSRGAERVRLLRRREAVRARCQRLARRRRIASDHRAHQLCAARRLQHLDERTRVGRVQHVRDEHLRGRAAAAEDGGGRVTTEQQGDHREAPRPGEVVRPLVRWCGRMDGMATVCYMLRGMLHLGLDLQPMASASEGAVAPWISSSATASSSASRLFGITGEGTLSTFLSPYLSTLRDC